MVYDNRHRTFLQAVMQEGALLDQDAAGLCYKIFNERISVPTVTVLINHKLAPIAMAMKSGICELTGDKYWSVVSTTHEEALSIPSEFNIAQKAFLRTIYSEIINSEDGCISSTDCLNLTAAIDYKLSMGDADKFLKTVVRKKWLLLKDGCIYMGVRSIIELMPYFRATFLDNFHNCFLCHQIVFAGQKCVTCDKMYHNYCLAKYAAMQKETKCANCKNSWDDVEIPEKILSQSMNQTSEEEPMDSAMDVSEEAEMIETSRKSKKRRRHHS